MRSLFFSKHVRSCTIKGSHCIVDKDKINSSIGRHADWKFVSGVLEKLVATSQKSEDLNCTTVKFENPTLMQSLYSVFSKEELYVGYQESNVLFFLGQ
jgi:hypothetical protein